MVAFEACAHALKRTHAAVARVGGGGAPCVCVCVCACLAACGCQLLPGSRRVRVSLGFKAARY